MSLPSRTRLALVLLIALAPVAVAQGLPIGPTAPTPSLPPVEDPDAPELDDLDIQEDGFVFQGSAASPSLVKVLAPDGTTAFQYARAADGSASVDIAGENVIADITLLAVEGTPMDDAFTLYVRDPAGNVHRIDVDRAQLASNVELPVAEHVPPVEVTRPPAWPGAPSAPFLVYVEDEGGQHLAAAKLDGSRWLKLAGVHEVGLQIPLPEADFSRVYLVASREGADESAAPSIVDFARIRDTADAAVFEAKARATNLGAQDGDEIVLQVFYERRASPLVVERFPEAVQYAYRVDGTGPSVSLQAPAQADDPSFVVTWNGADALSGLGGASIDWRVAGASEWSSWLTRSSPKTATFSGDWGTTYEFRATAHDAVGNPSEPKLATTTVSPAPGGAGAPQANAAPTAEITSPRTGAVVAGVTTIAWSATDADGTPLTSKLELSKDSGRTWRILFSGAGTSAAWDTVGESDGAGYRLRLTVTDGTKSATDDVSALTVRNVVAAPAAPSPDAPSTPSAPSAPAVPTEELQPAQDDAGAAGDAGSKGVPAPFVGASLLAAALLARRRRA